MLMSFSLVLVITLSGCVSPNRRLQPPNGRLLSIVDYLPRLKGETVTPQNNAVVSTAPSQTVTKVDDPGRQPLTPSSEVSLQLKELDAKIDKLGRMIAEYNSKLEEAKAKEAKETELDLEHNFSFTRTRSFVLAGAYAGEAYPGFSFTATTRNNRYSFKLAAMISNDHQVSDGIEVLKTPEEIKAFVPFETIARVETVSKVRDIIIVPSITIPILRYESMFKPEVGLVIYNIELRAGLAGDVHLHYFHSDYRVALLEGGTKTISLPARVSENWYWSYISTINLDIDYFVVIHLEADLVFNPSESKASLGFGLIW